MKVESTTVTVEGPVRTARVPSKSSPGVHYTVVVSCGCRGFIYNGHCYHLAEAGKVLRDNARAAKLASTEAVRDAVANAFGRDGENYVRR
jgi:hypothetical protein